MQRYLGLSGNSGVIAYAIAAEGIAVQFVDGKAYTYTYASTGRERVERMKTLAQAGQGLATYISQHVGGDYAACITPAD